MDLTSYFFACWSLRRLASSESTERGGISHVERLAARRLRAWFGRMLGRLAHEPAPCKAGCCC